MRKTVDADRIITFIEERMKQHSSTTWYEFAMLKELKKVKDFIEKLAEEDNGL